MTESAFMPTSPVEANEGFYRQIGPGGDPIYFDPARNPPVHQSRFLPTSSDTDGLSLVWRRFRTEVWSAYRIEQPTVRFRLAVLRQLRLEQLASELGFTAMSYDSTADALDVKFGEPWAHCVATSINRVDYDNDSEAKKRIKDWAMGVARIVTSRDVIGPFHEPTDDDPYRPADASPE